jgi:uncharacterized membrane protein YbhN (UPF0104 family)
MSDPPRPRSAWRRRALTWTLALFALGFVAWVVPIRDRCVDAAAPKSTMVSVSREANGDCLLHLRTGDMTISASSCAELKCEPGLASTLRRAKVGVLVGLFVIYLFGTLVWSLRWRMLLAFADARLSVLRIFRINLEAQAAGIILPGGLGGDALRIAFAIEAGVPSGIVVGSVLLDRAMGLVTLAGVAAGLGLAFGAGQLGVTGWLLAAIPPGFVVAVVVLRTKWIRSLRLLNEGRLGRLVKPLLEYMGNEGAPRAIVLGLLASLVVSAIQLFCVRGAVYALGVVPSDERWVYVGSAMAMIVSALPTLPGGWGTGDAAYVFFLGFAGLSPGVALAACLIYRLFWYLVGVVGAVLQLLPGRRMSSPKGAT